VSLGRLEAAAGVPQHYGLCGGMSFAAADLFLAGRARPEAASPPARGTGLFAYITRRQTESFGPGFTEPAKFGRWMAAPDGGSVGARAMTAPELERALSLLDAGRPVVLGLVHNRHPSNARAEGPTGALWDNHQVLAYAHSTPAPGSVALHVYDPNFPGEDGARVVCEIRVQGVGLGQPAGTAVGVPLLMPGIGAALTTPRSRAKLVRGFFVMPYERAEPPGLE